MPIGLGPPNPSEYDTGALRDWGQMYDLRSYPAGSPTVDGVAAAAAAVRTAASEGRGLVTWLVLGSSGAAAVWHPEFRKPVHAAIRVCEDYLLSTLALLLTGCVRAGFCSALPGAC